MSWFDIIKYNRDHYVEANKKHSDEGTINSHKKILDLVSNSSIKNKNMGRTINSIKNKQPVILGFPPIQEIINLSVEEVIGHLENLLKEVNGVFNEYKKTNRYYRDESLSKRTFHRFENSIVSAIEELTHYYNARISFRRERSAIQFDESMRQAVEYLLKPIYRLIRETNTSSRKGGRVTAAHKYHRRNNL